MSDEMNKIYCCERPDNSALLAELINAKSNSGSPAEMMALANSNNQWTNNPFIYLVWLMFMRGGMWGGDAQGENYNSRQIAALQETINTNHNNDLALQAINGNHEALHDLSMALGCSTSQIQAAVSGVQNAITQVGGQVGLTGERVINSILLGNKDLTQALQTCCCENKMLSMQNQAQTISRIDQLANGVQQGFSSVGYAAQANTNAIIQAGNANTQRILDTLNNHWQSDLQQRYADAKLELSQLNQNATLIAALKTT